MIRRYSHISITYFTILYHFSLPFLPTISYHNTRISTASCCECCRLKQTNKKTKNRCSNFSVIISIDSEKLVIFISRSLALKKKVSSLVSAKSLSIYHIVSFLSNGSFWLVFSSFFFPPGLLLNMINSQKRPYLIQ